jgi:hypothetical protein
MRMVEIVTDLRSVWSPFDFFLGGTEEYVTETASLLAKEGFQVRVYHNGKHGEFQGVQYLPHNLYRASDIVLAVRQRPPCLGKRNIFFTNNIHHRAKDFLDFDSIIAISNWHADHLLGREKVKVIYHGCWPEKLIGGTKTPRSCLYSSSPDRGLAFLFNIWPEVHARTGAFLDITYGARLPKKISGVRCLGKLSSSEMDEIYRQSQFWLHPCTGIELFCISGFKAQTAGCIPVVVPKMALEETIFCGIKTTYTDYMSELIQAIQNPPTPPQLKLWDWKKVTDELISLF